MSPRLLVLFLAAFFDCGLAYRTTNGLNSTQQKALDAEVTDADGRPRKKKGRHKATDQAKRPQRPHKSKGKRIPVNKEARAAQELVDEFKVADSTAKQGDSFGNPDGVYAPLTPAPTSWDDTERDDTSTFDLFADHDYMTSEDSAKPGAPTASPTMSRAYQPQDKKGWDLVSDKIHDGSFIARVKAQMEQEGYPTPQTPPAQPPPPIRQPPPVPPRPTAPAALPLAAAKPKVAAKGKCVCKNTKSDGCPTLFGQCSKCHGCAWVAIKGRCLRADPNVVPGCD